MPPWPAIHPGPHDLHLHSSEPRDPKRKQSRKATRSETTRGHPVTELRHGAGGPPTLGGAAIVNGHEDCSNSQAVHQTILYSMKDHERYATLID